MKNRYPHIAIVVILGFGLVSMIVGLEAHQAAAMAVIPDWQQGNPNDFGDPLNRQISSMGFLGEYFYAGVRYLMDPEATSAEIWRTSDNTKWDQVAFAGFEDVNNRWSYWDNATGVYKDQPYITTNNRVTDSEVGSKTLDTYKIYMPLVLYNYPIIETGKVVFVSNRDGNDEIYSMSYDGSSVIRLTNNSSEDMSPRWSPDGLKIVFDSDRTGGYEIYVMNADGSNQQKITSMEDSFSPRWSPDGTRIAFVYDGGSGPIIYTMDPDGSDLVAVTDPAMYASSPSWAPNGDKIAFIGSLTEPGIYMVDTDGGNQELIYASDGLASFAWSPDGTQLAITKWAPPEFNFDLYLYDIDSAILTRLTQNTRNNLNVDWSPYGQYLIFSSNRDDLTNFEIYTMNLPGLEIKNLTHNSAADVYPNWVK